MKLSIWPHFAKGVPTYLARYYWWAYLWRPAACFFDHQPIINAILFGQYSRLLNSTFELLQQRPAGRILQLSCVYGKLTPVLANVHQANEIYLTDVAELQLMRTRNKLLSSCQKHLPIVRMNAESLAWCDNSFDTVIIFFLLHELPPEARERVLSEVMRVLAPSGQLLVTEYGSLPTQHWLYRFVGSRWLLTRLEPFLNGFWHEDLSAQLRKQACLHGKQFELQHQNNFFSGFYRVCQYQVGA